METQDFLARQFVTLRDEIKATKARLFTIVMVGLIGVPLLAHFASKSEFLVWLLLPYSVLMLIILFVTEQSSMMRAGRFIREQIEPRIAPAPSWEAWIESRSDLRMMDRYYVACFMVIFFLYYFITSGVSVDLILRKEAADMSGTGMYWYWFGGAVLAYVIGAIWAFFTLLHHWKEAVSTSNVGALGSRPPAVTAG